MLRQPGIPVSAGNTIHIDQTMRHSIKIRIPVFLLTTTLQIASAIAQSASPGSRDAVQNTGDSSTMSEVVVVAKALDLSRDEIVPELGATKYSIDNTQIEVQSQGDNASFNQTLLRFPGMAQDSYGQLHLRGEHANLQYRIDDVLLPEGISGFGQELSTRFVDNLSVITGALPAQFGFRTAGIVDIHTKSGSNLNGGDVSIYGGSYDTINPSFQLGNTVGKLTYYFTGSYLHNALGIENPTPDSWAIHDDTNQYRGFGYLSYVIDDTSRINLIMSGGYSTFQIPNNPGQPQAYTLAGVPVFDSANLNENQNEQNYYAIASYQKKLDNLDYQVSVFTRYSGLDYLPDNNGDLIFNGVASRVQQSILSNGLQWDASYKLNESHTLRGGITFTAEYAKTNTSDLVFPGVSDAQTSSTPFNITNNSNQMGYLGGVYLQDEWKIISPLTLNFGGRFDVSSAYITETQFSPRVNLVFQPTDKTTMHAGYARYFTPPPLELIVPPQFPASFVGTTNANPDGITQNSPVKSERSNYFDAGITQVITRDFHMGLDGYYKHAQNQLDEGQFGQALIYAPFNYAVGQVYGVELTANYDHNGFSAYANLAFSHAMGKQITSGQVQFGADELAYISKNWVYLDHDQRWTASTGASYTWNGTKVYADLISGSGLRSGFANTDELPAYATVNLGIAHTFDIPRLGKLTARFDIVNLLDKVYEIRDGSGIGVFAPQYGQRRGFYGGLSYAF